MIEGSESSRGRTRVTRLGILFCTNPGATQHHPLLKHRNQMRDIWMDLKKKKKPFSTEMGGPASPHQPTLPLPQSGPHTETCRNCENHLLSQVFFVLFVCFVCFRSECQPLNSLREEGLTGRGRVVYILILFF